MQILSAEQIRAWDEFTISNEPISSIDLMERAAAKCASWIQELYPLGKFAIFCGKGNNGGDGLVIARLLTDAGAAVSVYILEFGFLGTADFQANLARLHQTEATIKFISSENLVPEIGRDEIVIDSLLGTGLNRPLDGLTAFLVKHINQSDATVIAIDMPTGLYADRSSSGNIVISATHTLSFQCYRIAFLIGENEKFLGELHILDIGLLAEFPGLYKSNYQLIDEKLVRGIIQPRKPYSHKGTYGHAALIAGSEGMMGAAILSARAVLRSGAGKLSVHVTKDQSILIQQSFYEAICKVETGSTHIEVLSGLDKYDAIGIGPGLGDYPSNKDLISQVFNSGKPIVIDADGLNTIAKHQSIFSSIPGDAIITPHPKEFSNLFEETANDFDRIQLATQKAKEHRIVIILKGHHTFIATPAGMGYFNTTGNAGMATAGSGDVLTGMITGLLAQKYDAEKAAIAAVWLHGLAGDLAAEAISQPSLIASDIIDYLGKAFLKLSGLPPA